MIEKLSEVCSIDSDAGLSVSSFSIQFTRNSRIALPYPLSSVRTGSLHMVLAPFGPLVHV
jgi:hypothetical protein